MTVQPAQILAQVESQTVDYGGAWSVNHAKRLITIVHQIAVDKKYNQQTVHLAAYLHDWGGYEPWKRPGVDHAERSAEVILEILPALGASTEMTTQVAECARTHHRCGLDASVEAILLHDADAIDFLGMTGILRNFSMFPRDLRKAFDRTKERMSYAVDHLLLSSSRTVAEPLILRTQDLLGIFEQETAGLF